MSIAIFASKIQIFLFENKNHNRLWSFSLDLKVKVSYTILNTYFEHENISFSETFSWQGEKFVRRPGEKSHILYRKKRDLDSSRHSWSQPKHKTDERNFVIAENIRIIDEYLVGSPRRPFRFPTHVFVIAITSANEPHFDSICMNVLEKLWNNYGIGNIIIITPCQGDPEVWQLVIPNLFFAKSDRMMWILEFFFLLNF